MSRKAWAVLATSTMFTSWIIYYVHYSQTRDKQRLREGIFDDLDRQEKKAQKLHLQQADVIKMLRPQDINHDQKKRLIADDNQVSSVQ